jgi:hypothetical protein
MPKKSPFLRAKLRKRGDNQAGGQSAVQRVRFCAAEALEKRNLFSTTFLVTNIADSGAGSLRQAITSANQTGGSTVIDFAIGSGVQTIEPLSPLPNLGTNITIDGTTQPGYAGVPLIVIDGSLAGSATYGLDVAGGSCTIRGLAIDHFGSNGIYLGGTGGSIVQADYIGVTSAGTSAAHWNQRCGKRRHRQFGFRRVHLQRKLQRHRWIGRGRWKRDLRE